MKKLFAVGATAALMLAATSPAFADTIIVTDDGDDGNTDVQFVDASQFQAAAALQTNEGAAVAVADDGSTADASIDQSLTIDQGQINAGLGGLFFVD